VAEAESDWVYIHLRGASMYPTLLDGDLLRASRVGPACVGSGDVIAYRGQESRRLVVHRVVRLLKRSDGRRIYAVTAGDSSGEDPPVRLDESGVIRVESVLRDGAWFAVRNLRLFSGLCYRKVIRVFRDLAGQSRFLFEYLGVHKLFLKGQEGEWKKTGFRKATRSQSSME